MLLRGLSVECDEMTRGIKMSEVYVGAWLVSIVPNQADSEGPIFVTDITERGFKYSCERTRSFIAREGSYFPREGHEHFGHDGVTFYRFAP